MLIRFGALAVLAGLGVGLLLRLLLGVRRFPALVAGAHLPLFVHALIVARGGWSEGAAPASVLTFLAAGVLLAVVGAVIGSRWADARPWVAAFLPGIAGLLYTFLPFLLFERVVSVVGAAGRLPLTSYGIFFLSLATVFVVCALLPFAPRAPEPRRW